MSKEATLFSEQGYVVARGLLDRETVDGLSNSFKRTVDNSLAQLGRGGPTSSLLEALEKLHGADINTYKRVVGSLWRKETATKVCNDSRIIGFLKEKFGWSDIYLPGGQVALIMAESLRIPGGYFGIVSHQDFPSVQGSLDGVVVWFPLMDVAADNFPMEIIPGSHLRGMLPMIDHGPSTSEVDPACIADMNFVPLEMMAGDVAFMSVFTVHRSCLVGRPDAFRVAMSTRFDNADEPTFVERCYPTAYTRSVERRQYVKDFPQLDQVKATFAPAAS